MVCIYRIPENFTLIISHKYLIELICIKLWFMRNKSSKTKQINIIIPNPKTLANSFILSELECFTKRIILLIYCCYQGTFFIGIRVEYLCLFALFVWKSWFVIGMFILCIFRVLFSLGNNYFLITALIIRHKFSNTDLKKSNWNIHSTINNN